MTEPFHPASHARARPAAAALYFAASGTTMSYGQLDAASNRSAHVLRRLGLIRGDVVATLFGNTEEVFVFGWAAQRTGLYATSISNKLSAFDVAYILRDCGAKLLVVSDALADLATQALSLDPLLATVPAFGWSVATARLQDWCGLASTAPAGPVADETPGSDLLYSSGTTGRPKGVKPALPAPRLDSGSDIGSDIGSGTPLTTMGTELYGMGPDTVYLSTSPLYHAAPLRWAMTVQRLGGQVVVMDRFEPMAALALIERFKVTHATFVPTHFVRMLKLPEPERTRFDHSSLRAAIHSAAPCPVPVKQAMIDWWGPILHEYYSGTESCGITALSSSEWLRKPGSVGRAVLGIVKVLDDDGKELPVGREGQIFFADGPAFAYLNDPAKTAEAHSAEGWATLGDIGRLDEDGFVYLTDRKSFMIISGGVNIYPQIIENYLITHPAVADVAVIGAPHEEMGEEVVAVIQPVVWADAADALAAELRAFARAGLGGVMTPRRIVFRPTLPREPTGKLLKRLLITQV